MDARIKLDKSKSIFNLHKIFFNLSFTLILFSAITPSVFSQVLRGKVTDQQTGEPLVDATVTLKNKQKKYNTITGLDGSYVFKNIEAGTYSEAIQFVVVLIKSVKAACKVTAGRFSKLVG